VILGGSLDDEAPSLRSAFRNSNYPDFRILNIGARCAKTSP
jgi:formylglycine-generating enzyme required for sulfatase activity